MMGLPDGRKSFTIGLVVLIQYRLWQPASQPPSHAATQPDTLPQLICAMLSHHA